MSKLMLALATFVAIAPIAYGDEFSESRAAIGRKNGVTYRLAPLAPAPGSRPQPVAEAVTTTPEPAPTPSSAPDVATGTGSSGNDLAGLYAALSTMIFGKDQSILEAQAGMTDTLEGESDFYWGGFKVWSSKPQWKDGAFQIAAGLPTVSMRAPLVRVPVGPVTVAVDAGVAAEASVTAKIAPLISIPIQFTSVKATLEPDLSASGFLEGYAKFLIVRAGVGGELQLIRSDAKLSAQVSFGAFPPQFGFEGFIHLLAGKIYGFVDYFNLFGWKWKRALEPVFASWKGKCLALSPTVGGADPCASSVP